MLYICCHDINEQLSLLLSFVFLQFKKKSHFSTVNTKFEHHILTKKNYNNNNKRTNKRSDSKGNSLQQPTCTNDVKIKTPTILIVYAVKQRIYHNTT